MTKSAYFMTKPASKMTDLKAQNAQKLPFSPVFDLLSCADLAVLGADCQRAAADSFCSPFLGGLTLSSGAPCLPLLLPLLGKLNPTCSAVPLVPSPGAGSQHLPEFVLLSLALRAAALFLSPQKLDNTAKFCLCGRY